MQRIFDLLPSGAHAEVYQLETTDQTAAFSAGELKAVESRSLGGFALRTIKNGKLGFATASGAASIPWLVQAAQAAAADGCQARLAWPTATVGSLDIDPTLARLSAADLIELADSLQRLVQAHSEHMLVQAEARLVKETTKVRNTAGGNSVTSRLRLALSYDAELIDGQEILNIYGWQSNGQLTGLDLHNFVATTLGPLQQAKQLAPIASGQHPVLLTSKAFSSICARPLWAAFSGHNLLQGTSPLSGKLGDQPFSSNLTIIDDATLPLSPSTASIDDEGVPTRPLHLIERGLVKGFAYDLATAARAGTASTGHARKIGRISGARLNALPLPGCSNLLVQPGKMSFQQLLQTVGNGVMVDQISGTPGFNPNGDFTVTVQLGYVVQQGQIVGRIKNAMLSGNVFNLLGHILAIGRDASWLGGGESGSLWAPQMVVDSLYVTSKDNGVQ